MTTIHTIGHSTLSQDDFIAALNANGIKRLVDIRSYPGSRRVPHFGKDAMARWLPEAGIMYTHLVGLGGRKHTCADCSPNHWWTHPAFRSYADYALTAPFHTELRALLRLADERPCAIMCSEVQWWKCHRRIVSEYILASGIDVRHIMGASAKPAELSSGALVAARKITYPPMQARFECLELAA
jgi:uncharacterized protein (DUF488 family)